MANKDLVTREEIAKEVKEFIDDVEITMSMEPETKELVQKFADSVAEFQVTVAATSRIDDLQTRVNSSIDIIEQHWERDTDRQWILDQVMRKLLATSYASWVKSQDGWSKGSRPA